MGVAGGQLVSSVGRRISGGSVVHLPMGYEGPHMYHRNEDFLGLEGSKTSYGS